MAHRWSEPSGSKGRHRFRAWPVGADSYDHVELAANWDTLDAIIGVPSGGPAWPTVEGLGGGIWGEINTAKAAALPVGAVLPWYRPTTALALNSLFEYCDGRVVSDHDFPGVAGSVTMPDLRNAFVMGANPNLPLTDPASGGAAVASSLINASGGAPAIGGIGGVNRVTLALAQMAQHQHTGSLTGWSPQQETWYNDGDAKVAVGSEVVRYDSGHSIGAGAGGGGFAQHQHFITGLSSEGGDLPHSNRPLWVGLIFIGKVRKA
jgi:hypothetical protein